MVRIFLAALVFLFSLLAVLPIPAKQLWYAGVAVTEFSWVGVLLAVGLLVWSLLAKRRRIAGIALSTVAVALFLTPIVRAYGVARGLDAGLQAAFGEGTQKLPAQHRAHAFSMGKMLGAKDWKDVPYTTHQYTVAGGEALSLNFYRAQGGPGLGAGEDSLRPCLLVVHGGSWKKGTNAELPDVNRYFASAGYGVASINYRLAPEHHSPAPVEDVRSALSWLRANAAALGIQQDNFVLVGRSAGGQIVLASAYSLADPGIRGVMSFYGPTDLLYAWDDPHNPLVMKHRDVLSDFLGGPPATHRQQYVEASAVSYVNARTPPTLLVHGGLDQHVHAEESAILQRKLQAAGVPHYYLHLPWATHGCEYSLRSPSGQLSVYAMERFMAAVTSR